LNAALSGRRWIAQTVPSRVKEECCIPWVQVHNAEKGENESPWKQQNTILRYGNGNNNIFPSPLTFN
jgi:hypothetical protein